MAQLHELARPNKIFRDRTTGKTDKPCPKKVASKKDLVGKDQRGLRERSPAVDVRVMAKRRLSSLQHSFWGSLDRHRCFLLPSLLLRLRWGERGYGFCEKVEFSLARHGDVAGES